MQIKASSVQFLAVLACAMLFFSGCEEETQLSQRRIRLVGDENLKLKEQLTICNQQIAKLEEVIAECENQEQQRAESEKKMGEMVLKMLKDSDAAARKIERLTDENLKLQAGIAELESKLTGSVNEADGL